MDPKDINQTSFCKKNIDNIISNELKQYILNDMFTRTNIKFNLNYAKIYNNQYKKNLNNPHILCLKTYGTPYLLYCTHVYSYQQQKGRGRRWAVRILKPLMR